MVVFALSALVIAQSMFGGLPIDGVGCNATEGAVEHIHARLQIFNRGHAVEIPQGVGIPAGAGCLYWVHTHSADGYIHIESPVRRDFTLGQFFDIWGPELSWTRAASAVAPAGARLFVWVNGQPWHGANPRAIVLRDRETIVIQSGAPFGKPLPSDWSKL
ncbi:MAG: hypothetical protein JOY69_00285 [Candidatus Eremiobacteraeota bacterium]|nr:hypothetical protein [Candidatus Eremiobacteraeota bacterium]